MQLTESQTGQRTEPHEQTARHNLPAGSGDTGRSALQPRRLPMAGEMSAEQLARGLAWFSIGLGLMELLAPRVVGRIAGGQGRHTGLIRLYGLRELASGLFIFSQGRKPATALWSRVAGDAIDLATLGLAFVSPRTNKAGVAFAAANVAGVTALDVHCARELSRDVGLMTDDGRIRVERSITVNRPAEELYRFWKDPANLVRFMYGLESVRPIDERHSHWIAKAPAGKTLEWDSEITEDRPNERIAWRSVEGASVDHAGSVRFEPRPGGRGTIVRLELQYRPPGGAAGAAFAVLFAEAPEQRIYNDLRRFKQVIETGEIVRSDANPEGAGQLLQRPAQPLAGEPQPPASSSAQPL